MMRRLIRNENGGMMAEAVIVLPAFILVWTLINFVRHGYEEAANASVDVRREGWSHAQGSTDGRSHRDTRNEANFSRAACAGSPGAGVGANQSRLYSGIAGAAGVLIDGGAELLLFQPLVLVGEYREIASFQMFKNHYTKSGSVSRPPALGGSARFGHNTYIPCDEKEKEHDSGVHGLWIAGAFAIAILRI